MNALIEALIKVRDQYNFSDSQLSRELRIDKSTWSCIKNGKRKLGLKFLRSVIRTFPELSILCYAYISVDKIYTKSLETHLNGFQRALQSLCGVWVRVRDKFRILNRGEY